jgi:hypothetical protein
MFAVMQTLWFTYQSGSPIYKGLSLLVSCTSVRNMGVNHRSNNSKLTKRTIKYLAVCDNKKVLRDVLHNSSDAVVKKISDIALNALKGNVDLTPARRHQFGKYRREITALSDKNIPLKRKRAILTQTGGFAWIPALIGTVVGAIGSSLFGGGK